MTCARLTYYNIELSLDSPLCIGSSYSTRTDVDVLCDADGKPFIPASSLAGLFRSYCTEAEQEDLFGFVRISSKNNDNAEDALEHEESRESRLRVFDGLVEGDYAINERDNVALKTNEKIADKGKKFDRQVVEQGARFRTYLEILQSTADDEQIVEGILGAIKSGDLRLGSKTTRGFGRLNVVSCKRRSFSLEDPGEKAEWLDFDMFSDVDVWGGQEIADEIIEPESDDIVISLSLDSVSAVSIREYSTDVGEADYHAMWLKGTQSARELGGDPVPIIPASSWVGAIRSRYRQFAGAEKERRLFGYVSSVSGDNAAKTRSKITVSESVLNGGHYKSITRNAIDRFTGGTQESALYSEETYCGGGADLELRISAEYRTEKMLADLAPLFAALTDLHNGFLAVGGLTAVGRGLFRIRKATICGSDATHALQEGLIEEALELARACHQEPEVG